MHLDAFIVAVISGIVVFIGFFLFNLCAAPYRIERDARKEANKALAQERAEHEATKQALAEARATPEMPRRLTEDQKAKLAALLVDWAPRPEQINVVYSPTSAESADFAADFGDAFEAAGITTWVHDGPMFDHRVRDRGVYVIGSSEAGSLAEAIGVLLTDLGIPTRHRDTSEGVSNTALYIARKPET